MRKRNLIIVSAIAVVGIVLIYIQFISPKPATIEYTTAGIEKGSITSYITASGTLKTTQRIEIRPSVSGTVREIKVSLNDSVRKGDVLAVLDDRLYRTQHEEAMSKFRNAKSELEVRERIINSDRRLYERELISRHELDESMSRYNAALAAFEESKAAKELAEINLDGTRIRSLLDGKVISMNINIGQSVAIDERTVPLFVIVSPLEQLNLVSNVNEADIGNIQPGQEVVFRVSAHRDRNFTGEVIEISNDARIENNIVTYDIISEVVNPDLILKPGMSAEVNIITSVRDNVLKVPASALRVIPPEAPERYTASLAGRTTQYLWTIDEQGNLRPHEVRTGATDGTYTEVSGDTIEEGKKVIVGFTTKRAAENGSIITLPQPQRF